MSPVCKLCMPAYYYYFSNNSLAWLACLCVWAKWQCDSCYCQFELSFHLQMNSFSLKWLFKAKYYAVVRELGADVLTELEQRDSLCLGNSILTATLSAGTNHRLREVWVFTTNACLTNTKWALTQFKRKMRIYAL